MIALLRRLFTKPERHYIAASGSYTHAVCVCGHESVWDWDLRKHFEETGRIGK